VIVDSSALVAMIRGEAEAQAYSEVIRGADVVRLSAAGYVELAVVLDGLRDPIASGVLDDVLAAFHIQIEPLTASQARIARTAYQQFGKGSGHPARLNMGDCFAYALARDLGEPLLFKGRDFTLTDIELVIEPIKHRRLSEVVAGYGVALP
jgi:ribonuclease VapC